MSLGRAATDRLLEAVRAVDVVAVGQCFTPEARYANVPHPPAVGRAAIEGLFAPILSRTERVRWDIVSAAYDDRVAWLERVDRFWIDGREYAIECHGVFRADPVTGLLVEVRDYVDLGVWRARLGDALSPTR